MDHHTIKKQHALLYRTDDGLVEIRRPMSESERKAFFRQHNLTTTPSRTTRRPASSTLAPTRSFSGSFSGSFAAASARR